MRDGRRSRLRVLRAGCGKTLRPGAAARSSAGADGGASYLGDVAWHRFAVRRGDAARRTVPMAPEELLRGGGADLSARSRRWSGCWRCRRRSETAARLNFVSREPAGAGTFNNFALDKPRQKCKCYLHSQLEVVPWLVSPDPGLHVVVATWARHSRHPDRGRTDRLLASPVHSQGADRWAAGNHGASRWKTKCSACRRRWSACAPRWSSVRGGDMVGSTAVERQSRVRRLSHRDAASGSKMSSASSSDFLDRLALRQGQDRVRSVHGGPPQPQRRHRPAAAEPIVTQTDRSPRYRPSATAGGRLCCDGHGFGILGRALTTH